ncbi:double zinc ribbon domain-containing protein [Haloferax sp. YSMS24]|uniref:double zinc ribbon domain-containing protein n=1 Tax=Haloferax sp. YSMS24 TaxID=3388425 RepID=UPI00398D45D8
MTKITFRADDDLVERLDGLDTSKSEAMREALRQYLDQLERDETDAGQSPSSSQDYDDQSGLDAALSARVEALVDERLDERLPTLVDDVVSARTAERASPADLNVNINVDGAGVDSAVNAAYDPESTPNEERKTPNRLEESPAQATESSCEQCGESVNADHVYCPNCGEKASHRVFCECGDELRSDWAFCPDCGRRTPAADVLD